MALDPIVLDADPLPTLVGKVNAGFARLGLTGPGAPVQAADFLGQEYLDTESGRIHVARAAAAHRAGRARGRGHRAGRRR